MRGSLDGSPSPSRELARCLETRHVGEHDGEQHNLRRKSPRSRRCHRLIVTRRRRGATDCRVSLIFRDLKGFPDDAPCRASYGRCMRNGQAMRRESSGQRRRPSRSIFAGVLVALALSVDAVAAAPSNSPPTEFGLVFEGTQHAAVGPMKLRSEGSFTASAPACATGHAADTPFVEKLTVVREFKCADDHGSFTALVEPTTAEYGGHGTWKIIGGTGSCARLRGRGTFEGAFVTGRPTNEAPVTFRSTWSGLAALDDVAPTVSAVRSSVTKLHRPQGAYLLRITFSVRDDVVGNAVDYRVQARSGSRHTLRGTQARSDSVSVELRIRPPRGARRVLLEIRATDPVGNDSWATRSVDIADPNGRS